MFEVQVTYNSGRDEEPVVVATHPSWSAAVFHASKLVAEAAAQRGAPSTLTVDVVEPISGDLLAHWAHPFSATPVTNNRKATP